ncbi:uncharacterized protein LACBIDRAFT_321955 [Laccaria bicolor S238N-H82]|uniref:Predicted protein n=1 Tax=Laccaria bicolor (strain S238N-H82 / ATCC MYA-4686) TaxID=486041 RepID=B0CUR7_LACBS|nr:uncharacterized protein LACBIDRAFT_321955 [Laccaria bicolor S238N-H82]EDR14715.1 predicted protein [Laccaria bicolor S238N-H82]|eukprot:XP_001875274.1 predicted protein [Laccaria bicolor S238N-H82]
MPCKALAHTHKCDLVYRIAGFQRVYLETLTMFDLHTKWAFHLNEPTGKIHKVDESIMGAITDSTECIAMLYRVGAPGWCVRPPANLSTNMIIRMIVPPGWEKMPVIRGRLPNDVDPREFTYKEYPGTPYPTIITACPRSGEYVSACQNWREGHFGIIDPQPVVMHAVSGMAVVESFTGSQQPNVTLTNGSSGANANTTAQTSGVNTNNNAQTSVNHTKFHKPEHSFVPPQSPTWKNALAAVDTNPCRISSSLSARNLRGYQFPDPFLFISGNHKRLMILAWLMMQDQWLQSLVGVDSTPQLPSPQHWRSFLHDFAKIMQLGKKPNPSNQRRAQKAKEAQGSIFSSAVSIGDRPGTVYWGDVVAMQGETDHLSLLMMAQVIWNAFEQNLRYEVRHLDRYLLPSAWTSDSSAGVRENLIRSIFPEDSDGVLVAGVPLFTQGLAAEKWQDRLAPIHVVIDTLTYEYIASIFTFV